ncbi:MAG: aspartyl/asparaginyl beta-hydroxylase domain-containing protein [Proteobacteria bacterium]|nr:aspartyl/asparaginyl beta-hydroxylase domain-containing protein [Pseudomonadota bacterium]
MARDAEAAGRLDEARQLLARAQLAAPDDAQVLNALARRELVAGNAGAARQLLARAVAADPRQAEIWLNLAAALRGLGQRAEEMAALERALALEPRHTRALLQKGSLHELTGELRAAAAAYREALRTIPPGVAVPPAMRPAIDGARRVVAENNRRLEAFLDERLAALRARHPPAERRRAERSLEILLQQAPIYRSQPSFLYLPGLAAVEFHDPAQFPWLAQVEAATDAIREELMAVLADGPETLEPYVRIPRGAPLDQWRELNESRRWGVYFLWREGRPFPEHIARCPRTVAALGGWPRCEIPGCAPTAVFSILEPHTRIPPHHGVNNARLIVHLPLVVPPGCEFRVGGERRSWEPGRALVFDDTIEHEAINDSDLPRAVLIFDIWHPALSAAGRELVAATCAAVGSYYGSFGSGVV